MSKALVIVVVVVVVVAEASIVDTPATIIAVVASVVVTASKKFYSVLTVLLFTYKSLCRKSFIFCTWCTVYVFLDFFLL